MELRTTFKIEPSERRITYSDPAMFIGSCFAASIGRHFELGHMPVMINPAGTVYNPVSVCNTLDSISGVKKYSYDDLYNHKGTWVSFDHYTDFSSGDPDEILKKINNRSTEALKFISSAKFLFVTFGTARVYRWLRSDRIVSNCHKIPASGFAHELLTVEDITVLWTNQLDRLKSLFPGLHIIFTISPVRHWKDGAHGNQLSKSVLFLAVEKLLEHPSNPSYFPAYELLMDDLRDYRFYEDDMLHPSTLATDYIWDAFCGCYFDNTTTSLWQEASKISRAVTHSIRSDSRDEINKFAENMISRIDSVTARHPYINFDTERTYFHKLI
jgi:hypothetical protein